MSFIITEGGFSQSIDPAIGLTLRLFLAAVFARALFGKLRAPAAFAAAIRGYALLPDRLVGIATAGLLSAEFAIVPALVAPSTAPNASIAAATLLLFYAGAIGINLARGRRDIDCGCAGPMRRQTLHELLVLRNLVYAALAICAAQPLATRPFAWLDGVTIPFAVSALVALSIAIDGISALAPVLGRKDVRT